LLDLEALLARLRDDAPRELQPCASALCARYGGI